MGAGYNHISDKTFLFFGALQIAAGVFGFYKVYIYLFKSSKKTATVVAVKNVKTHVSGETSKLFKYKFLVDNVKYTMPDGISIGGIKKYKKDDIVTVYITDEKNRIAIPSVLIIYTLIGSVLFIGTSIFLFYRG